jgi:integrase
MAKIIGRLSARGVAAIRKPGRHADGGNLYLSVSKNGARSWVFLFRWRGKPTEIGLGSPARGVTLALARERAAEARQQLAEGVNPKDARRALEGATFGECADRLIEAMRPSWRNEKHASQWTMTLGDYCIAIRRLPVADVTVEHVLEVLKPIWQSKPETASRLRGRIERVLDAAKAQGLRFGENPAAWKGNLAHLLPKPSKLTRGHFAALPYEDVPAFIGDLRAREGTAARALELCVLTAARSGEILGMRWEEIDLDRGVWIIPAERMKGGREHRVPLSDRALAILREMHDVRIGEFVFNGQVRNRPLSGWLSKRCFAG